MKTDDPRKFWNVIRNLGPKRCSKDVIPIKVKAASGYIVLKSSEVLATWKQNFRSLFTSKCRDEISILCFDQCTFDICLIEMNNSLMNEHILPYEVEFAFKRA